MTTALRIAPWFASILLALLLWAAGLSLKPTHDPIVGAGLPAMVVNDGIFFPE